ncbi:MAG: zinc-dependent alcohol dehydrogenase family protein [Rhodospirillaceae bacterium]
MKAIEFTAYGVPHIVCRCVEVPDAPAPGDREVTVMVEAAAINPADLLIFEGRYPGPKPPAHQGVEGAGRVTAVGAGVSDLAVGDRVMLLGRDNWVQYQTVPAAHAIRLPQALDILQAAQIKANPPSAMLMLRDYQDLAPGHWVIQNAANSAVGRHVIRLAHAKGIKTVNVVRRESLAAELTALGADIVLVDSDNLAERVRAEIGAEARLPLAIDAVAGASCLHLADCLSDGGTVVNYGFLSGEPCMLTPTHTIIKQITLVGFWLVKGLFAGPRDVIEATYAEVAQLFIDGVLHSPVEATYTLDQVREALAHAKRDGRHGKIVFTPNGAVS